MSDHGTSSTADTPVTGWRQGRYGFAVFFFVTLLAAWLALRLTLFLQFGREHTAPAEEILRIFLNGFHRDVLVGLAISIPLLTWFLIIPNRQFGRSWHRVLFRAGFFVFWLIQIFLLATEYYFFDEFRSRFNTVAVDYLLYPHEVFINIWDSYPVAWVVAGCAALSAAWVWEAGKMYRDMFTQPVKTGVRLAWWGAVIAVCAAMSQTISLKPLQVSRERLFNELANNGAVSFLAAAWTHQLDYGAFYRTMPLDAAYQRARQLLREPGVEFVTQGRNIRRRVQGDPKRPRLNVVVILEESLGSEFWGCLGRKEPSLTPCMDELARSEGMLFTNIYASGNRTVRGFEGVLSSFPPLPGESIVKRNLSENVESLARVLKRDGYSTVFLYGGRGLFDGMRHYAIRNGYDRFIEQKHFTNPTFTTVWGVCDEDLFARSIEEFREMAKGGAPFLGTLLTVSNHKPFTFPKGRIPENPDARWRDFAVKYSDYALGQFFAAAKKESFWTNTIFVVVADHGARVYGSQNIPIHSYEIPLLVAGPAVVKRPAAVPHLGCSLDVGPTILGLIGRPYESLFFGRDLLKSPPEENRVMINHNREIGMYRKERLVTLGLRQTIEFYQGDPKKVDMKRVAQPGALEKQLEADCTALYQVADDLYMHLRYQIDPK